MRSMPLLWGVRASAAGLVVDLCLGMGLGVVALLLVLMRRVHITVNWRVLLAGHVVGVGSSLLVVVGVGGRIVEGVDALAVIWVVGRRRHGPAHVCLVVVWMWRVSHAVRTHSSIHLALGGRRHGRVVTLWRPSLRLHTQITTHQRGLMVIGAKSLMFIDNIRLPRCHHSVLRRDGGPF